MNWTRTILDGLALALIFNTTVGMFWFIMPKSFSEMMPKEIREAAGRRTKKEKLQLAAWMYPLYIFIIAYMIFSTYEAGINGFWNMFWTAYIEMFFINLGDFFGLDWLLREKIKDKIMIAGTENCKAWETSEWMKTLAIPEHFIIWPFIICPVVGFICAGIGTLIR